MAPVIVLSPAEAALACGGDWPAGAWLVVTLPGRAGETSWEAAHAADVPDVARGRPVWPPFLGLAEVPADPAVEVAVMDLLAVSSGIADLVRAALQPASQEPGATDDHPWHG